MWRGLRWVFLAVLLGGAAWLLGACTSAGSVSGQVTDSSTHLPIAGARVLISTVGSDTGVTATADETGHYGPVSVEPGTYVVHVTDPAGQHLAAYVGGSSDEAGATRVVVASGGTAVADQGLVPAMPHVGLTTSQGQVGTPYTVTGSGWVPGSQVAVSIGGYADCTLQATSDGSLPGGACLVPPIGGGPEPVRAVDSTHGLLATGGDFDVTPRLPVQTATMPGGYLSVNGDGFKTGLVDLWVDGTMISKPYSVGAGPDGAVRTTLYLPTDLTLGHHVLTVTEAAGPASASAPFEAYRPTASVEATPGRPGEPLPVLVQGWAPGRPGSIEVDGTVGCAFTADGTGTVHSTACTIPRVPTGSHHVVVRGTADALTADAGTFEVHPKVMVTYPAAPAGTTMSVTMVGYLPSSLMSGTWDGTPINLDWSPRSTDPYGSVTTMDAFVVPSGAAPGPHTLAVSDGSSTASTQVTVIVPTVEVTPGAGPPGTPLTVTGHNWLPGAWVSLYFGTPYSAVCAGNADQAGYWAPTGCRYPGGVGLIPVTAKMGDVSATGIPFRGLPTLLNDPPRRATAGRSVQTMGSNFTASSALTFDLDGRVVPATTPNPVTNDSGSFEVRVAIPADMPAGPHTLTVTDSAGIYSFVTVVVYRPTVTFSPGSATAGTTVTATGTGWVPGDQITVSIGGYAVCSATTDAAGSFTSNCKVPPVAAGPQPVVATDTNATQAHWINATDFVVIGP